jgi:hypothetical protein
MMRMLEAGGIPLLTDNRRAPDVDNPAGYFEFEQVKELAAGDRDWLRAASGQAVKVVSPLLEHLPPEHTYRVVFMRRHMAEILASQRQMLAHRNEPPGARDDAAMADVFERHLRRVQAWLAAQPNLRVLDVHYNRLLEDPTEGIRQIQGFLDVRLDEARMAAAIDPHLYRNRIRPFVKEQR